MSDQQPQQEQPQQGHHPFPFPSPARNLLQNTTQMPSTALGIPGTTPAAHRSSAAPCFDASSHPSGSGCTAALEKLAIEAPAPTSPDLFEPSPIDAFVARMLLQRGLSLPAEIVDSIIDDAEYWPHSTTEVDYFKKLDSALSANGSTGRENMFLFRCPPVGLCTAPRGSEPSYEWHPVQPAPLAAEHPREFFEKHVRGPRPELMHPVKKVVFKIESRDQGWASDDLANRGTYKNSWTWFEAGLERFDAQETLGETDRAHDGSSSLDRDGLPALNVNALRPLYPTLVTGPAPPGQDADDGNSASNHVHSLYHGMHPDYDHTVQANKRATMQTTEHRVEWSWTDRAKQDEDAEDAGSVTEEGRGTGTYSGNFVRELKLGDVVTFWAKARFPGWRNLVSSARVDIYWAV